MINLIPILILELLNVASSHYEEPCHPYSCEFGECIAEGSSFRCKCRDDHVGPTCNVWRSPLVNCDVDGPLICFNGGVCNITENKFRCECPPNFTGLFCEKDIDECAMSPCRNGATCVNQIGGFYCICPGGFKGTTCEQSVDLCSSDTCKNGGSCIDSVDGYVCKCPPGFSGQHCQIPKFNFVSPSKDISSGIRGLCSGCLAKASNALCDKECDRFECGYDGGDCTLGPRKPFDACISASYCSQVFRNGVCDEVCNTHTCLFDGFDCLPKKPRCPEDCKAKKHNGICNEECNKEECEFDGGDCKMTTRILSGELSIVVLTTPHLFVTNVQRFLRTLSKTLRSEIRIKNDNLGPMVFLWSDGHVGERLIIKEQDLSYYHAELAYFHRKGILIRVLVDVSKCTDYCLDDVEVVASFIEAAKDKLTDMNMTIYSAVATKTKIRRDTLESTLMFVLMCISVMIIIAVLFIVQQRANRKRKVIENAPVWMPPMDLENESCGHYNKEKDGERIIAIDSAKRRQLHPVGIRLLEEKLTPNAPRVYVLPKPKKLEPEPSRLHIEAASSEPISSPSSCEEANKRGPNGRTPLMLLARNMLKTEEQLVEDLSTLHAGGANLNLCDDNDDAALHMAVSSGHVALVRKLLQLGASPIIRDRTNSTCLHLAARACASRMVEALLEVEEMRQEVDALDDENRTALMLVGMHDMVDTKIAQMLCDAGAVVDCDGDNSLRTWRGRTALHFAAKHDNAQMVAFLLEKGANKDCQDYECCTPLHLAASEGHALAVKELLKAGASVMLRNDKSQTPYDTALVNNRENVITLLASGDNLRTQLYSSRGEIFPSSSSPSFKCAKVLMAKHPQCTYVSHVSHGSPKSAQSTPARCLSDRHSGFSPYHHNGTPHSVAAFKSTYSSPQFASPLLSSTETSLPSPHPLQSSTYSSHQNQPLRISVAHTKEIVMSPHYGNGQMFSSRERTLATSSMYFDSGFGTLTDISGYDRNGPWSSKEEYPASNEAIESVQQRIASNGEFII